MSEQAYNGWTNYPTWNVKLWLDNEYGLYQMVREEAQRIVKASREYKPEDGPSRSPRFELADWLKYLVRDDLMVDMDASMFSDLLGWALDCVNWDEIAENILEDLED